MKKRKTGYYWCKDGNVWGICFWSYEKQIWTTIDGRFAPDFFVREIDENQIIHNVNHAKTISK